MKTIIFTHTYSLREYFKNRVTANLVSYVLLYNYKNIVQKIFDFELNIEQDSIL